MSLLYLKITVSASAKAASDTRSGAPNRDAGKEQVSASAMGETGTVVDSGYKNSSVSLVRLVQMQTGGREEVAGPWCALNARAEVGNGRSFTSRSGSGSYTTTTHITGLFRALTSYGSQLVNFSNYTNAQSFNYSKLEPDDKELDVYVDRNYAIVGNAEDPLQAFWEGAAGYSIGASVDGSPLFDPQGYYWTISGQPSPLPQNATEEEVLQRDPNYSAPNKFFPFDLGDVTEASLDSFPKSTTVLGSVTGAAADSEVLTGKVKINWHLTPAMLFELRVELQPQWPAGETPDDGANDIWADINEIEEIQREFVETGAVLVKTAFEGQVMIASFYVPDEVDLALGVGRAAKLGRFAGKLAGIAKSLGARGVSAWRRRRRAAGKSDNVAFRVLGSLSNKGPIGTRRPNIRYGPDEPAGAVERFDDRVDGPPYCFAAGTPVVMADGSTKLIEEIKVGDEVLSRSEKTGETKAKKVTQVSRNQASATLVLHLPNGQRIETTPEHPIYAEGRGFVKAGTLGIGNTIVTRAGPSVAIEKLQRKSGPTAVYNFAVEEFHTYFVGTPGSQLWVHNADCIKKLPDGEVPPNGVSQEHWLDLGWDPAVKDWRKNEAEQAHWLENREGVALRRVQPNDTKSGDWMMVDEPFTSYDGVGGSWRLPGMDPSKVQPDVFTVSIRRHLDEKQNCDYVLVDLIGLPDRTRNLILDWINRLPQVDRDRLIIMN